MQAEREKVEPLTPAHPPLTGAKAGARSARGAGHRGTQLAIWTLNLGPVLILAILLLALSAWVPYFATGRNVTNVLQQSSVVAMLALGQLVVMLARGIDISMAAQVGFASVVGAQFFNDSHPPAVVVILAVLGLTASIGLLNGLVLIYGRMPHPFIVTIGTYSIFSGLGYAISAQPVSGVPEVLNTIGSNEVLGVVPLTAVVVAATVVAVAVLLRQTRWGRWVYAIGGNPEAARRTGIPVNPVVISTYVVAGICAGIAALLSMGIGDAGDPSAATNALLYAVVAVVIGGASFLGGRGSASAPVVGALIIGAINNGLGLLSVNPFYQNVVLGLVLLVAVAADVQRGRLVGRLRILRTLEAEEQQHAER